jgi:hypothetical protein
VHVFITNRLPTHGLFALPPGATRRAVRETPAQRSARRTSIYPAWNQPTKTIAFGNCFCA